MVWNANFMCVSFSNLTLNLNSLEGSCGISQYLDSIPKVLLLLAFLVCNEVIVFFVKGYTICVLSAH